MNPVDKLIDIAKSFRYKMNEDVYRISKFILEDKKFALWSGSSKESQHHYGQGGLAKHTLEVVQSSLLMHEYYKTKVNPCKIFLAALYHDYGKLWDYEPVLHQEDYHTGWSLNYKEWQGTQHKNKIHHLPRSAIEFSKIVNDCFGRRIADFVDCEDEIVHAILSHHGLREWGSPVSPQSKLAWILHLCDGMSARLNESNE